MTRLRTILVRPMFIALLGGGLGLAAACSDGGGGGNGNGTGGGTGGGNGGGNGGGSDAGAEAAADASGGTKANGETCTADGDCVSTHCKAQGAGGGTGGGGGGAGRVGSFCTIFCSEPRVSPAADCSASIYTGKCSGMSFCEVK